MFESSESQAVINSFRSLLKGKLKKSNMFIMPFLPDNENLCNRFNKVISFLKEDFEIFILELSAKNCGLTNQHKIPDNLLFKCITIDSGKPETIRDIIKEALWSTNNIGDSKSLKDILSGIKIDVKPFTLSRYGIFIPYRMQKFSQISTRSFNHKPVFYRYRVATKKLSILPPQLDSYLKLLFFNCPNHLFQKAELRASAQVCSNFGIKNDIKHSHESDLIEFAKKSESFNEFKSRHENLQKYFLINDSKSIACEVPLWLESSELKDYVDIFRTKDTLTGHIDLLRYENDGKIGIWDYKPYASLELNAFFQVSLYALMLSFRTGISIKNFICGYFDETDVFSLDPKLILSHCLRGNQ